MLWGLAHCMTRACKSMTLAAAALVRGRKLNIPSCPSPPQHMESMGIALDNLCPTCLDSWEKASYITSCLQQFCNTSMLWWAERKSKCRPCKKRVTSSLHLVRRDDSFPSDHLWSHQSSST